MITVEIKINNRVIHKIDAYRLEQFMGNDVVYTYEIIGKNNKRIRHKFKNGAVALARKMLKILQQTEKEAPKNIHDKFEDPL